MTDSAKLATAEEEPKASMLTEYSRRDRLKRRVTDMSRHGV